MPSVSAAAGEELIGAVVRAGQPGTVAPLAMSNAYTLPSWAPTTTDGRPRLATTGEDSRRVTPGRSRSQTSTGAAGAGGGGGGDVIDVEVTVGGGPTVFETGGGVVGAGRAAPTRGR